MYHIVANTFVLDIQHTINLEINISPHKTQFKEWKKHHCHTYLMILKC